MEISDSSNIRIVTPVTPVADMGRAAEYPASPQDHQKQGQKRAPGEQTAAAGEPQGETAPNIIYRPDGSTEDLTVTTAKPTFDVTG